jgi:hypothetical protein
MIWKAGVLDRQLLLPLAVWVENFEGIAAVELVLLKEMTSVCLRTSR